MANTQNFVDLIEDIIGDIIGDCIDGLTGEINLYFNKSRVAFVYLMLFVTLACQMKL